MRAPTASPLFSTRTSLIDLYVHLGCLNRFISAELRCNKAFRRGGKRRRPSRRNAVEHGSSAHGRFLFRSTDVRATGVRYSCRSSVIPPRSCAHAGSPKPAQARPHERIPRLRPRDPPKRPKPCPCALSRHTHFHSAGDVSNRPPPSACHGQRRSRKSRQMHSRC